MSLMSLEEALAQLLEQAAAEPIAEVETLALAQAAGRVLAEPLDAALDLPPWPNSAMDGYALRHADAQGEPLAVSQKIFAGHAPQPLVAGTCARIFTGAPLPEGADTVEMQENVEVLADGRVRLLQALRPGQNVRPRGQEARVGDRLLEAGTRLGPLELGVAANLGVAQLRVRRQPRVVVFSTGDELVEPGQPLGPGQIYNSNRTLLVAWLERLGCAVVDGGILADDPALIRASLAAHAGADLLLSSGGVSVGEADYLGQILKQEGELKLWKLALKPGKPLTCARYANTPVIGLPGNPVSALVTFGLLVRPYLLRRLGVARVAPLSVAVPADFAWERSGTRREFPRARLVDGRAQLYANQSSGVLAGASWADGLVEIREGRTYQNGDSVAFIPWSALLG